MTDTEARNSSCCLITRVGIDRQSDKSQWLRFHYSYLRVKECSECKAASNTNCCFITVMCVKESVVTDTIQQETLNAVLLHRQYNNRYPLLFHHGLCIEEFDDRIILFTMTQQSKEKATNKVYLSLGFVGIARAVTNNIDLFTGLCWNSQSCHQQHRSVHRAFVE